MPNRAERPLRNLRRLQSQLWPIIETAGAAVVAWYLAKLLLGDRETGFAPIATLICLGATLGQQRERALELTGAVELGVLIADGLVRVIGSGPPQVGVMVVLAMSTAALVGGGTLLMTEAGVSAIIIGSVEPETVGLFPTRPIEALLGGAVAFVVHLLLFPPDPLLHVGRAAQAVFSGLGRTLEEVAGALWTGDREQARRALEIARGIDVDLRALDEALEVGRDTARTAPLRRPARGRLEAQQEIARHLDFATRNIRVLARDVARHTRTGENPVPDLADAVQDLAQAVWALATAFEEPGTDDAPRSLALQAAAKASEAMARHADITLTEIAGQVRSTAADLVRASSAGSPAGDLSDAATEEMLADQLDLGPPRTG